MSIDSSATTDAPAATTGAPADPESAAPYLDDADEDMDDVGSTTAGGPTMIWVLTGIFVLVSWLRRRRRKRRQTS